MAEPIHRAHPEPAWRDRANFAIHAEAPEVNGTAVFEQLAARQLGPTTFQVCCVPFYTLGVALGDEVETSPDSYVVRSVLRPSGACTLRLWFGSAGLSARDALLARAVSEGGTVEAVSRDLVALSAPDLASGQAMAGWLEEAERRGEVEYETTW